MVQKPYKILETQRMLRKMGRKPKFLTHAVCFQLTLQCMKDSRSFYAVSQQAWPPQIPPIIQELFHTGSRNPWWDSYSALHKPQGRE